MYVEENPFASEAVQNREFDSYSLCEYSIFEYKNNLYLIGSWNFVSNETDNNIYLIQKGLEALIDLIWLKFL